MAGRGCHVDFVLFSCNKCASGVLLDHGFPLELVQYVWDKHGHAMADFLSDHSAFAWLLADGSWKCKYGKYHDRRVALCLYAALWYHHHTPAALKAIGGHSFGDEGKAIKEGTFREQVMPVVFYLAGCLDEVNSADRFDWGNHGTGMMRRRITRMFDTCPIVVTEGPGLFQPKYGAPVYKLQIGINFLGWITDATGPHLGQAPDNIIFDDAVEEEEIEFEDWEWALGDGIYHSCDRVITKFQQDRNGIFSKAEIYVNAYMNFYRQRVEHIMHVLKSHNMWRRPFLGDYDKLVAFLKVRPLYRSNNCILNTVFHRSTSTSLTCASRKAGTTPRHLGTPDTTTAHTTKGSRGVAPVKSNPAPASLRL
jgi:hypothetical protein